MTGTGEASAGGGAAGSGRRRGGERSAAAGFWGGALVIIADKPTSQVFKVSHIYIKQWRLVVLVWCVGAVAWGILDHCRFDRSRRCAADPASMWGRRTAVFAGCTDQDGGHAAWPADTGERGGRHLSGGAGKMWANTGVWHLQRVGSSGGCLGAEIESANLRGSPQPQPTAFQPAGEAPF